MFSRTTYDSVRKEEKEAEWNVRTQGISRHLYSSDFDRFLARHPVAGLADFLPNKFQRDSIGTG